MILEQQNIWARLVKATPAERVWLDGNLSCDARSYRKGMWGKITEGDTVSMLDPITGMFPAGFIAPVIEAAKESGITVEVDDQRGPPPCRLDDFADLGWLRGYQEEAVWAASEAGRGLIKVPTAGGKTEIFVGLAKTLPCEWLFVVHRGDLTGQAARRFQLRTGETAGTFQGGEWKRGSANVTVATFQAIYHAVRKKMPGVWELINGIQAINVDEVHAQPAETFYKVGMGMKNAYFRVGQSGTPLDRGELESLRTVGCIGPIVYQIRTDTLVEAGVLSKPKLYMVPCRQPGTTDCDWHTVYHQLIVHSETRNALVADMAERAAKPCLLFIDEMAHGEDLRRRLTQKGLNVDFVHGGHGPHQRLGKIQMLVESKVDVLICSVIFQEGIDIPQLESVVVATGKASVVGALQRIGRGMRTAKGKTGFEVWDVHDRGQRWLSEHANDRLKAYRNEGHDVTLGWPGDLTPSPPKA